MLVLRVLILKYGYKTSLMVNTRRVRYTTTYAFSVHYRCDWKHSKRLIQAIPRHQIR